MLSGIWNIQKYLFLDFLLRYFRKFYRKTPVLESLFNKVADLQACNFIKETFTPTQVFSCATCEIFQNNVFYRTPPVAASEC